MISSCGNLSFQHVYFVFFKRYILTDWSHTLDFPHVELVCLGGHSGEPVSYVLVEAVREALADGQALSGDETEESQDPPSASDDGSFNVQEDIMTQGVAAEPGSGGGGLYSFTVGLIGKPSAGKSTFFNATTQLDPAVDRLAARVGAHPFTTINPHFASAYYQEVCPCAELLDSGAVCDAEFGHGLVGRRLPLTIKDVAGLIPGACEGLGLGNRFLNDLCDADVLMHIVDSSGLTNERGQACEDGDPADDIRWLAMEVHRWIYGNVLKQWDSIKRRPERLKVVGHAAWGYH